MRHPLLSERSFRHGIDEDGSSYLSFEIEDGIDFLIDEGDETLIGDCRWQLRRHHGHMYVIRSSGHRKGGVVLMHRQIMSPPTHLEIDHIDGNGLNNRKHNLRAVTLQQNRCRVHRVSRNRNRDLPRGVYINAVGGIYSNITVRRKTTYLGQFATIAEAETAFKAATKAARGEFAMNA